MGFDKPVIRDDKRLNFYEITLPLTERKSARYEKKNAAEFEKELNLVKRSTELGQNKVTKSKIKNDQVDKKVTKIKINADSVSKALNLDKNGRMTKPENKLLINALKILKYCHYCSSM